MRCLKVCRAALIGVGLGSGVQCEARRREPGDAGNGAPQAAGDQSDQPRWQAKFQGTYIFQKKPSFPAAYTGQNSLVPDAERSYTVTLTAYLGLRPWRGGELFVVPELTQGLPFSNLTGLAGFNNGELTRASGTEPRLYRQKLYLRQTWNLGGGVEEVEADLEQFPKFV